MLIASTGLGKTIMAAHVVAYLRMKNVIDSVIVISPAGLKTMWRRTMRAAKITSVEFSYYSMSLDDWKRYSFIDDLRWELKRADERTIVIIDESHHLRNETIANELRLRNERILGLQNKSVKILLMTATPYSKNVQDINAQLRLLPPRGVRSELLGGEEIEHWYVDKPSQLSDTENCVVLTAPSVVRFFSSKDSEGNHFVRFYGNEKRYFPFKIHMKNLNYTNPCDPYIIYLLKSGLLRGDEGEVYTGSLFEDHLLGKRNPFWEALLVNQLCSSVKEADRVMEKMENPGGFENIRFHNQEKLHDYIATVRPKLRGLIDQDNTQHTDDKIAKVVQVINEHSTEKVVVFCHYKETSRYVRDTLTSMYPDKIIDSTVDKDSDDLEKIIRLFAPVANKIDITDSDGLEHVDGEGIDILVATGSLAEGFNLQDAAVLINEGVRSSV